MPADMPVMDFENSRYGHGRMLSERFGALYTDMITTGGC